MNAMGRRQLRDRAAFDQMRLDQIPRLRHRRSPLVGCLLCLDTGVAYLLKPDTSPSAYSLGFGLLSGLRRPGGTVIESGWLRLIPIVLWHDCGTVVARATCSSPAPQVFPRKHGQTIRNPWQSQPVTDEELKLDPKAPNRLRIGTCRALLQWVFDNVEGWTADSPRKRPTSF